MHSKLTYGLKSARVALPCALIFAAAAPLSYGDAHDKKTDVTIRQPIEVPGTVLEPGTYTFKLLDEPSDRHIVQISSQDAKITYALVFTAAARRTEATSDPLMTFYEAPQGSPQAVNKWFWPGDLDGQQFIYSHAQAQKIAQASGVTVPELTGQQSAELKQQTQPQPAAVTQTPPPPVVAQNNSPVKPEQNSINNPPPAPAPESPAVAQAEPAPQPAPPAANGNNNENTQNLPETSSELPLIGLLGLIALGMGAALRSARANRRDLRAARAGDAKAFGK